MSPIGKDIVNMIDMLPEQEQLLALEMVKRIVLAWDSDYTRLTELERQRLEDGMKDFENGETTSHDNIDWN